MKFVNSSSPSAPYMSVNWFSIGLGNGLVPNRRQAITWTNADLLSIGPLGTNFSESWIEILTFAFKKIRLKTSSVKWRLICPGGEELIIPFTTKKDYSLTSCQKSFLPKRVIHNRAMLSNGSLVWNLVSLQWPPRGHHFIIRGCCLSVAPLRCSMASWFSANGSTAFKWKLYCHWLRIKIDSLAPGRFQWSF